MKPLIRQKLNTVIDLIMFVVMVALAVIGFLIRYSLISGEKRWERFGRNLDMTFLGLDRHEWGLIHLILGISLATLLVLHIIFHWTQIVNMVKKLFHGQTLRVMVVSGLTVICCIILLTPFVFSPDLGEPIRRQGEGFGRMIEQPDQVESSFMETEKETLRQDSQKNVELQSFDDEIIEVQPTMDEISHHSDEARILEIRGYHTLAGLAVKYNVSVDEMKSRLNIPSGVSDNERLGRIRRIYGFTMREVEDCILSLQKSQ